MNSQAVKQTLHELIDQIEDDELLAIYLQLLHRELKQNNSKNFFNTTDDDLLARAEASLKSVVEGRTRSITDFKKDIEEWKGRRAI